MDRFRIVVDAAKGQNEEGDFPSWLLTDILALARAPERYAGKEDLVELLIRQVQDYDCYAGAGCFNASVSADTIKATLREIDRSQDLA